MWFEGDLAAISNMLDNHIEYLPNSRDDGNEEAMVGVNAVA